MIKLIIKTNEFAETLQFEVYNNKSLAGIVEYVQVVPDEKGIWFFPLTFLHNRNIISTIGDCISPSQSMILLDGKVRYSNTLISKKRQIHRAIKQYIQDYPNQTFF